MRQIYEYHPVIGFRFIPQTKARLPHEGGGYLIRTNECGFRCDHPFRRERTPGKHRILLFGDSFTAGEGVSNGQRYGDHLERLLPNLEVYNFGLPATGLDQHYLIYQEYAQHIVHDLLIIAVFVENVRRVGSRYRYFLNETGKRVLYAKPYYTLRNDRLELHGVPPPKLPLDPDQIPEADRRYIFANERFPKLKSWFNHFKQRPSARNLIIRSGLKDFALTLLRYQPVPEYDAPGNPAWRVMQALIKQWIKQHPTPVVLMPIPLHQNVYGISSARSYQKRLRASAESAGGTFVDPLVALMRPALRERKTFYFPDDGHLTKIGHAALAEAVAPAIRALLETRRTS